MPLYPNARVLAPTTVMSVFKKMVNCTKSLLDAIKEDYVPRLSDYIPQLGACLLVEATDRLFRDYNEEHIALSTADEYDQSSESEAYSEMEREGALPTPSLRTKSSTKHNMSLY
jgi:hypothetical protein